MRRAAVTLACLSLSCPAAFAGDLSATAYQVTPAHNAIVQFSNSWGPALQPLWTTTLDGAASYPLVANGYVYTLVAGNPDEIVAINESTGAIAWKLSTGSNGSIGLAYDSDKLFTVNSGGTLSAFNAVKGKLAWAQQLPGQYYFTSEPSALNGIVYVGGAGDGGTLYAARATDGKLLWTQSVENGDDSSPAVTNDGVYVAYPCQYYDFAPKTGQVIWHYAGGCDGGGGDTVVVGSGLAFVRDFSGLEGNTIFNARTGATIGSFAASAPPVVVGGKLAYFLDDGTLSGIAPRTSQLFWEFSGDGELSTPPIAVNSWVVAVSGAGKVYVLDGKTGAVAFSTKVTGTIGNTLGAGAGMILIPAGNTLVALGSTT